MSQTRNILLLCGLLTLPIVSLAYDVSDDKLQKEIKRLNMQVDAILNSIFQQLRQLTAAQATSATKISETVSQTADNTIQRSLDAQREVASQNINRNTRMPIDPCANGSRGISDPSFDRLQPGYANGTIPRRFGGGATANIPSTGSPSLDKAIKISNGLVDAPSPETQALLAQEGTCVSYAAGQRSVSCKAAGTKTGTVTYPNADVQADSLFVGAQKRADAGKTSDVFSPAQMAAAQAFLRNISNPVTLRDLMPAEAKTEEGRKYFALRDSYGARLDLAMRPAYQYLNDRVKYKGTIPIVQAMIDGNGASATYLSTQLPLVAPDWKTEGISLQQLMSFEAGRRYQNADWIKEIAQISDPMTLQREKLAMTARDIDLAARQLRGTEQSNIVRGALYQAVLNQDLMPEVLAQYRKATIGR